MSLLASILLVVIGAVVGILGTIVTQSANNRYQARQTQRERHTERFRPLLIDINRMANSVRDPPKSLDVRKDDLRVCIDELGVLSTKLNAEPSCYGLARIADEARSQCISLLSVLENPAAYINASDYIARVTTDLGTLNDTFQKLIHYASIHMQDLEKGI